MRWDLFCRVVDNFGDIGVCWRLARELAARGQSVRLFVDDASALVWMAGTERPAAIVVDDWATAQALPDVADVVVEAFGCDPPEGYLRALAATRPAPRWINLEYLSAEDCVERSHRLPSPQLSGPAAGLTKTFFYPGFTPATGGLLREPGLLARRDAFDRDAWLAARGWERRADERVLLLFAYRNAALPALLQRLAQPAEPATLLLLAAGASQPQALDALAALPARGALRPLALPFVSQDDFDRLLWSADVSFVRGEDSLVRAVWAGEPFVWHAYPQRDRAHTAKVEALLARLLAGADGADAARVGALFRWWNADAAAPSPSRWPDGARWRALVRGWRDALTRQDDLCTQLLRHAGAAG